MAGLALSPPSRSALPFVSALSTVLSKRGISTFSSAPLWLCHRRPASTTSPNKCRDDVIVTSTSVRSFSSQTKMVPKGKGPVVVTGDDGRQFAVVHTSRRKLKPKIVRRRLERMKIYEGKERDIRYSPFRLNLICRLVAGMPLVEALEQLQFCSKDKAPLVQKVLKRTSNLADIRDGLQMSQLEVAECFATHGHHIKGFRPMGRGR